MLREASLPAAVAEQSPLHVQDRSLEWLRYPNWGGSAYVAVHPLDAEYVQARGYLRIDGIRAVVRGVNETPFLNGKVGIEVDFQGRWRGQHP